MQLVSTIPAPERVRRPRRSAHAAAEIMSDQDRTVDTELVEPGQQVLRLFGDGGGRARHVGGASMLLGVLL